MCPPVVCAMPRELAERFARAVQRKPLRKCRSLHVCELCLREIRDGQLYHDGGWGKRAHLDCVRFALRLVVP